MGSNLNFKNAGVDGENGGTFTFPITRQSSVYSLTFDEFQSSVGGTGKDFGSMNMDEFLKNIWSAEENQSIGSISGGTGPLSQETGNSLQRQGSLILPRTLSLKTVDEVWQDMSKECADGIGDLSGQPTLGEITLEEFLSRAGVMREENLVASNIEFGFGYDPNISGIGGLMGCGNGDQIVIQSPNLPLNVNGIRSPAYQHQQQPLLPNQASLAFGPAPVVTSSVNRGGIADPIMNNNTVVNNLGILGLRGNVVDTGSPAVSSDGLTKNSGDTSSVSPVPYAFNGGFRGRKVTAVEKIVERRHRRMIKNRESAARSRARKQAYTMELEAEVAKLKEENQDLQKKHADMMDTHKKQVMEMMNHKKMVAERRHLHLRRTHTGPW